MDLFTSLLIGIGLSMDCFAVSLAIGTTTRSQLRKTALVIAASFGFFQAGMTIVGWIAGTSLYTVISAYDHWIAFLLLAGIGIKMIHDGMKEETGTHFTGLHVIPVLLLSVATSIDALAAGVSFGVLGYSVLVPAIVIGLVCFAFSCTGVMCGMRLEKILGNKTEIAGGVILIMIGAQILSEIFPV
ncbi:manganese efflux pump MntP family protein [Methanoregula sp.]|jgi:putative Mn2+ efflux pump MntP|uniref:manganese efflux pump MntP n=1 Tax=Methanoregula sp. TaxID=2052170 RepID=UPI0025E6C0F5|nr:manganese efflux pump MntP family protein [Methanoregula sp.]